MVNCSTVCGHNRNDRMKTPGEIIDSLLLEQGLRKGWFAEQIGVPASHVSQLTGGSRPINLKMAERIRTTLKMSWPIYREFMSALRSKDDGLDAALKNLELHYFRMSVLPILVAWLERSLKQSVAIRNSGSVSHPLWQGFVEVQSAEFQPSSFRLYGGISQGAQSEIPVIAVAPSRMLGSGSLPESPSAQLPVTIGISPLPDAVRILASVSVHRKKRTAARLQIPVREGNG